MSIWEFHFMQLDLCSISNSKSVHRIAYQNEDNKVVHYSSWPSFLIKINIHYQFGGYTDILAFIWILIVYKQINKHCVILFAEYLLSNSTWWPETYYISDITISNHKASRNYIGRLPLEITYSLLQSKYWVQSKLDSNKILSPYLNVARKVGVEQNIYEMNIDK